MTLKIHQSNLNLHLTETKYGKFIVPTDDPTIGRSLDLYGEYCQSEIDLLKNLVKPNSWFIDIGANIGTHTIPLSFECQRVLAFEPDIENYTLLGKNVSGLCTEKNNVTLTHLAIGSESKKVDTEFDYGKTTIKDGDTVMMAPLDMLNLPQIDVVKIDVEGKELDVLVGMRTTLTTFKPDLLIEMQNTETYADTFDFLQSVNYKMYWFPVATYNHNNQKNNKENVFGNEHGVVNWVCTAYELNTMLEPVVDRDDTIERMTYRSRKNVGNDRKNGE